MKFQKRVLRAANALVASMAIVVAGSATAGAAPLGELESPSLSSSADSTEARQPGDDVLEWTEMGPWGPIAQDFPEVMVEQGLTEDISPTGTNVTCTPAAGENPVVPIRGMNSNAYQTYARMAPELQKMGKCLYAFNVGKLAPDEFSVLGKIPTMRNMSALDRGLAQLTEKIERLKHETGANEVDIVGHSAGGTLAAAYAKQQQGKGIGTVVSLAGVLHGTTLLGVSYGLEDLNAFDGAGDKAASFVVSPSVVDLLKHSDFVARLEDGGVKAPGVNYVAISTQLDEAVTPIASSQWTSPEAKNITVQDGCSADLSGHVGLTFSPRAIALVANALGRDVPVPCEPVTGFVDGGIHNNQHVRSETLDGVEQGMTALDQRIVEARK